MSKRAISPGEAGIGDFEPTADVVRNGCSGNLRDLRRLLADAFALYLENEELPLAYERSPFPRLSFCSLHEQAEQLFVITDDIAERARKLGEDSLHSISEISKTSTIEGRQPRIRPSRRRWLDFVRTIGSSHVSCACHTRSAKNTTMSPRPA